MSVHQSKSVLKSSYVYPTCINRTKYSKMNTINSIYPELCHSITFSKSQNNFHSMKTIEKNKDKSNKENQNIDNPEPIFDDVNEDLNVGQAAKDDDYLSPIAKEVVKVLPEIMPIIVDRLMDKIMPKVFNK